MGGNWGCALENGADKKQAIKGLIQSSAVYRQYRLFCPFIHLERVRATPASGNANHRVIASEFDPVTVARGVIAEDVLTAARHRYVCRKQCGVSLCNRGTWLERNAKRRRKAIRYPALEPKLVHPRDCLHSVPANNNAADSVDVKCDICGVEDVCINVHNGQLLPGIASAKASAYTECAACLRIRYDRQRID